MTLFDAPDAADEHGVDASMWLSEPHAVKSQPAGDDDQSGDAKSPVDVVADLDLRDAFMTTGEATVKMEIDSDLAGAADSVDMFDESVFEFKMMQLESAASPVPSASSSSDQASTSTGSLTELERRKLLSLERRRKRNREAMQRSRQRDKDYMDGLRDQAAELERHHDSLVEQMNQRLSLASDDSHVAELKAQLEEARQKAQALMEQNLKFQEDITDRMKSEDRMEGLLKELLKDQERTAGTLNAIFHEHMAPRLTSERAMEIIVAACNKRACIQKKRFPTVGHGYNFFGWEIHHYFHGKYLYMKFSKLFRNRTAEEISARAWNHAWQSFSYRSTMDPRKVTQYINDDTFISATDRYNHENPHEGVRVYNLRFRVREPDGVVCIGTQTLPESFYDSTLENVWGSDVCLATVFTPVQECDMATGELLEHCHIQFVGKTRFGPHQLAQQNALETVLSLARWEESSVGTTQRLLWTAETPDTPGIAHES